MPDLRDAIKSDLRSFISQPLRQASMSQLATLSHRTDNPDFLGIIKVKS